MGRRHDYELQNLLEKVAIEGFAAAPKEFFVRAYGSGQQRFTKAVRDAILEEWQELLSELRSDLPTLKLSKDLGLEFGETPKGHIIVTRSDIWWDDEAA